MKQRRQRGMRALLALGMLWIATASVAWGQPEAHNEGITFLTDWPAADLDAGADLAGFDDVDLLPFLDTLALEYFAYIEDDQPTMDLTLWWHPGAEGILDGERVPIGQLPSRLHLTALDLRAVVLVAGVPVSELLVAVDSLSLAAAPYVYPFTAQTTWADLFVDTDAETARGYLQAGFTLGDIEVLRVAFEEEPLASEENRPVSVRPRPRPPRRTGVYVPRPSIWVQVGRDPFLRPPRRVRGGVRPRGDDIARGTLRPPDERRTRGGRATPDADGETRTRAGEADQTTATRADPDRKADDSTAQRDGNRRGRGLPIGKKGKDDDDDDDSEELLPAALLGVAAVASLAVIGGSVGYFGEMTDAPIGLSSGFVRPRGGALIQVAVNEAVLGGSGTERFVAQLLVFGPVVRAPVQPALGLGLRAEAPGADVSVRPEVALGFVKPFGPVLAQVTYALVEGQLQLALSYNFRWRR